MVDCNKLRGIIAENGYSQPRVAEMLGIAPKTFYNKMKKGKFDSDEIYHMIKHLRISNPVEVFFADAVAPRAPAADNRR